MFKAFAKKQNGCKIKVIRIDRSQEYPASRNFIEEHGIQHQLTTRYMPQHNGVVESKQNRGEVSKEGCRK